MGTRRGLLSVWAGLCAAELMAGAARAQTVSYTYDALGRLSSVTDPGGQTRTYAYDAAGNRTLVQRDGTPPPPPPPPPPLSVALSSAQWSGGPNGDEDPLLDAMASGGPPPHSFTWVRVSGNTPTKAQPPMPSSCRWIYEGPLAAATKVSSWRCDVSDQAGVVVSSAPVTVRMRMS